jgi:hypothetical protein
VRRSEAPDTDGGNGEPPQTITEAQHRRLEARINELRLDRERVKGWCKRAFGVEHFPQLSPAQYQRLDEKLEEFSDIADREAAETVQGQTDTVPVDPDEHADFWAEYDAAEQTGGQPATGQGAAAGQGA